MEKLSKYNLVALFLVILTFNTVAMADELYGIFMVVKGSVEVDSVKTGKSTAKIGLKVYPGDKITTQKEARAKVVMSDRNVMNISPETTLTINRYENDPKSNVKNVELELSQGKVRNNVEQKYDGEKSKFIIKTPTAVAGVRGTQFLTTFNKVTQETSVITFKGTVQMAPILANGQVSTQAVMIKKGETSSLKKGQDSPEPPKAMPKEELNKAEKESQAKSNTKPDAPNEGSTVADQKNANDKTTDKKDGGDSSDSKKEADNKENKKDADKKNDKDSKDTKDSKEAKRDNESKKDNEGKENKRSDSASVNDAKEPNKPNSDLSGENKREPASDSKAVSNVDKVKEPVMIDKRDMDFGAAKEIKAPMVVELPSVQPIITRPPTIIQPTQQNPMIDEIVRSKLNKTTVIIRPIIPNK